MLDNYGAALASARKRHSPVNPRRACSRSGWRALREWLEAHVGTAEPQRSRVARDGVM
jgi:hypothetical protein